MRAKIKNFFYFKVLYTYLAYRSITILLLFCLIISFQMSCFIFTIESALFTHIVQCDDLNNSEHMAVSEETMGNVSVGGSVSAAIGSFDGIENFGSNSKVVDLSNTDDYIYNPENPHELNIEDFATLNYFLAIRNLPSNAFELDPFQIDSLAFNSFTDPYFYDSWNNADFPGNLCTREDRLLEIGESQILAASLETNNPDFRPDYVSIRNEYIRVNGHAYYNIYDIINHIDELESVKNVTLETYSVQEQQEAYETYLAPGISAKERYVAFLKYSRIYFLAEAHKNWRRSVRNRFYGPPIAASIVRLPKLCLFTLSTGAVRVLKRHTNP